MNNYTTIKQSKKLLELGLNPESADMTYCALVETLDPFTIKSWEVNVGLDPAIKNNLFSYREGYMLPCWSLKSLLSLYPKIEVESNIETFTCKSYGLKDDELLKQIKGFDRIEPTFRMVVWLLENNYIKAGK